MSEESFKAPITTNNLNVYFFDGSNMINDRAAPVVPRRNLLSGIEHEVIWPSTRILKAPEPLVAGLEIHEYPVLGIIDFTLPDSAACASQTLPIVCVPCFETNLLTVTFALPGLIAYGFRDCMDPSRYTVYQGRSLFKQVSNTALAPVNFVQVLQANLKLALGKMYVKEQCLMAPVKNFRKESVAQMLVTYLLRDTDINILGYNREDIPLFSTVKSHKGYLSRLKTNNKKKLF